MSDAVRRVVFLDDDNRVVELAAATQAVEQVLDDSNRVVEERWVLLLPIPREAPDA